MRDLADYIHLGDNTYDTTTTTPPPPPRPPGPSGQVIYYGPKPVPISEVPEASRPLIVAYDVAAVLTAPCPWSAANKAKYDELMASQYVTAQQKVQLRSEANQCIAQAKPVVKPSVQAPTMTWTPPTWDFSEVTKPATKPVTKPGVPPSVQVVLPPPSPSQDPKPTITTPTPSVSRPVLDLDSSTKIEELERQRVEWQERQKKELERLRAEQEKLKKQVITQTAQKERVDEYGQYLPGPRPLDIPSMTYVSKIPSALEVSQYQRPSPSARAGITVPRLLEEPTSRIPTFQQKVERTGGDSFITSIQNIFSPVGLIQFFSGFDLINFYFEKGRESARPKKTVVVPKAEARVKIGGLGLKDATIEQAEKLLIPVYEEAKKEAIRQLGLPENIETFSLGPPATKKLTDDQKRNLSYIKGIAKNIRQATLVLPKKEDVNSKYLQDSVIGKAMSDLQRNASLWSGLRKLFQEYELEVLALIAFLEMREKWNVGVITTLCDDVQATDDIAAFNAAIKFITGIQNMMKDVITIPRNIITKLVDKKTSWGGGVSTLPFLTERRDKYKKEVEALENAIQESVRGGDAPPEHLKQRLTLAVDLWTYFHNLVRIHKEKEPATTGL
jgi:hypothetical protein